MSKLISLLERISFLKSQILNGKKSLIDEDLELFFIELKKLVSPSELETSVQIMDKGTIILEQKLEELKHFISLISQKNKIFEFIKNIQSDDQIYTILSESWQFPLVLPHFSLSFLTHSFEQLVINRRNRKTDIDIYDLPILENNIIKNLPKIDKTYKIKMMEYFDSIKSQLPATLEEILEEIDPTYISDDIYFEYFTYILHLLQLGLFTFDNLSKKFFLKKIIKGKKNESV